MATTPVIPFPSPAFSDTVVTPGQLAVIEGRDGEGNRHVLAVAGFRPYPFTEFNARRRKRDSLPYATWQAMMRDHLKAALRRTETPAYPRTAILGLAMAFGARREVMPGQQRATSVRTWDLRNLEKALEDVCKSVLWHDDQQVRYAGPGSARDVTADWWALHAWDGDIGWQSKWARYSVPELEVERCRERSVSEPMA